MLTAGTAKRYLQVGKSTFKVSLDRAIYQSVGMVEKRQYLTIFFKKIFYRCIQAGELLVLVILAGIVCGTTIEYVSATVARVVGGESLLK